jgi:hypothetical protein
LTSASPLCYNNAYPHTKVDINYEEIPVNVIIVLSGNDLGYGVCGTKGGICDTADHSRYAALRNCRNFFDTGNNAF